VIDLKRLREEPAYRVGIERKRVAPDLVVGLEHGLRHGESSCDGAADAR